MTETIRKIDTSLISDSVKKMIREAGFSLPAEICSRFREMQEKETSPLAAGTLAVLRENAAIAEAEQMPLCQDCGSTIVFMETGQNVLLTGDSPETAINRGVAEAYTEYYLRKSIVGDPLKRTNTGTNTPAFIHYSIVPGNTVKLTVYLKGGGSENMSCLKMFRPTDSPDLIIDFIVQWIRDAGPNPCPPLFLGVGIGGTADVATLNAKTAVLRGTGTHHPDPFYRDMEQKILEKVNQTGVGVLGFGGNSTAAEVYIKEAPSHIASLAVALNLNCHSLRYRSMEL